MTMPRGETKRAWWMPEKPDKSVYQDWLKRFYPDNWREIKDNQQMYDYWVSIGKPSDIQNVSQFQRTIPLPTYPSYGQLEPPPSGFTGVSKISTQEPIRPALFKAWTPPTQGGGVSQVAPEVTPTEEDKKTDFVWYVPGMVLLDRISGKFYDKDSQAEINPTMAVQMLNEYNRQQWEPMETQRQTQRELEYVKQQNQLLSRGGAFQIDMRRQQAQVFDKWRSDFLSQHTGPAYEVARWFVQHSQNPYTPSAAEGIGRDIGTREAQLPGVQEAAGQGPGGIDTQIGAKAQQLAQEIEGLQSEIGEVERDREEALALSRRGPATPSWMPEYVPGVGKYLGALPRVPTPSGQQLTKMQPSQAQYLSGAIDWFGGRPWEDILAEAEVMQPRAPRRTATQWRPQTQRRV